MAPRPERARPAALLAACAAGVLGACSGGDPELSGLAAACIRASRDPLVMHTASLLSDAEVTVEGDEIRVLASIPVGIGLDLKLRFRYWEYRCRREGDALVFVGYERRR